MPETKQLNSAINLPQLTFTRFVAAIAIVIYHDKGATYPLDGKEVKYYVDFWNCFVSYFFVLSGFILVVSSYRDGVLKVNKRNFWVNRFARIYPLYFFALVMYLVLSLNATHKIEALTPQKVALTSLLIQSWFPEYVMAYNGPAWSLSVEAFFYLSFPFIIQLFRSLKIKLFAILVFVCWFVSLGVFVFLVNQGYPMLFTHYFPVFHLNEFLLGILTGILFLKFPQCLKKKYLLPAIIIGCAILLIGIVDHNSFLENYYDNGLFAPLFCVVILFLCTETKGIRKYLAHRYAVYLGEISYGIYILQIPFSILIYGVNKRTFKLPHTYEFYIYLIGLVIISALCYEIIEKPSRKYLKNKLSFKHSPSTRQKSENIAPHLQTDINT